MSHAAALRFGCFDIEATSLDASYGRLVCACIKFGDEDGVRTVTVPKFANEKVALVKITEWIHETDILVTWYGKMFDIPFLNSRLMHHGMLPLPRKMHKDLCFESKSKFRFRGNRLDNISKDLKTKLAKFDVPASQWILAAEGHKGAIADIVKHCQLDVLLTEEVLGRMKPLILNITR